MTPKEIEDTYTELATQAPDYTNAIIERAGQAQSSYGPLAASVMGDSQTAGIGNYTYNRLARPAVNQMTSQLVSAGLSAALNRQLSQALNQAKQNYNNAYNGRQNSLISGTSSAPTTNNVPLSDIEEEVTQNYTYVGDVVTFYDPNDPSNTHVIRRAPNQDTKSFNRVIAEYQTANPGMKIKAGE